VTSCVRGGDERGRMGGSGFPDRRARMPSDRDDVCPYRGSSCVCTRRAAVTSGSAQLHIACVTVTAKDVAGRASHVGCEERTGGNEPTRVELVEIDRTSDRPVYKQVADALRAAIRSGELADGQLLASETELMDRYGVSRNSARNAVALLRVEGLVVTEHGRGTFVRAHRPMRRLSSSRYAKAKRQAPLHAEAAEQDGNAEQRLLGVDVVDPPEEVADRLGLLADGKAVVRRDLLWVGGDPVQLAHRYFPLDVAQGKRIERDENIPGGVHAELEQELGYELDRFVEELTFRMPTPEEARKLRMGAGVPVVRVLRTLYDISGRVLEVSDCVLAGDRHELVYETSAG
jgi:GntR family transcriptional regulator